MPRIAFYVLFTASGFAGLIYESIWTHYLKLYLGHAAYAQSLVLVVFMGGMALGAAWCARLSERLANPLLGYALVEAVIGAAALVFHPIFVLATDWSYDSLLPLLGSEWPVLGAKLALSCLLILPQSILLGMTFPLMSAGLARAHPAAQGESIAMLYFTNSLGAAAGVLASGFVLIAWVGLPGTLRTAGFLNFALALAVWLIARPARLPPIAASAHAGAGARFLLGVAFFTGLASFVYEIAWIRMLSLVLGSSTHAFELMLSTFILGLALGGLAVRRHVDGAASPERLLGWVQVAMGLAALATLPLYNFTFELMEALMRGLARTDTGYLFFNLAGQGIAALVMLPTTFLAGMTLPLITGALLRRGSGERAIGRVYAANTFGAIAGVLFAVHVGLPALGLKGALLAGCAVDIALGLALLRAFSGRSFLWAGTASAALLLATFAGVELDANKMTAGVFRHGELASSRDAEVIYAKDGKTATVHLVKYGDALSLRTNGKSDGSVDMDRDSPRGTDEITMVLTAALPLALKPDARSAAVIGIGTGLTTHTLLQSLAIERVDTVEIEAAMAEAARGFMPRNTGAFADPRGTIRIDDAKTYFSSANRRYDIIISEPSNPWVSGVSSLFTREFYRRVRAHLEPGGLLVQWMQLYEIDASLVATMLRALGEEFAHYAVYAASDHDLLVVAGEQPVPAAAQPAVFEHPGLAKELWTVHMLSVGDFDGRYLGSRETLEPLVASYGMPANSDYAPVLDLNAARHRFTEKSAAELIALANLEIPVLELLERSRSRRPVNPLFKGAYAFERYENTRLAWYARDFLASPRTPQPEGVPTQLQKDLELIRLRLLECREPRELDVWLNSAARVAGAVNPFLAPDDAGVIWDLAASKWCFAELQEFQRRWLSLFRAVALRDAPRMAEHAERLLATQPGLGAEPLEYLVLAAMAGRLAMADPTGAAAAWQAHGSRVRDPGRPAWRLLRCHADPSGCVAAFRPFAAH